MSPATNLVKHDQGQYQVNKLLGMSPLIYITIDRLSY
jgi:hypothetical protein